MHEGKELRPQGVAGSAKFSTLKGGLGLTELQYFEFGECLLRLKIRSIGGEWPMAFDSILGTS